MSAITIAIPAYNSANTIKETIQSALAQDANKRILVIDDGSTDETVHIVRSFNSPLITVKLNKQNKGIGYTLYRLMQECQTKYIVYLSSDDVFTNSLVCSDIINIFESNAQLGVLGRYFNFFLDKNPGIIGVCRDKNIFTQSCCPSGMAFRTYKNITFSNRIFIEMPHIVKQFLNKYSWSMIEYDTVSARFHPGGNTGTKEEYYKESPFLNWLDLTGEPVRFYEGFIQLKNRCPKRLLDEIRITVKYDRACLLRPSFYIYAIIALVTPRNILQKMTLLYRDKIQRLFSKPITREMICKES